LPKGNNFVVGVNNNAAVVAASNDLFNKLRQQFSNKMYFMVSPDIPIFIFFDNIDRPKVLLFNSKQCNTHTHLMFLIMYTNKHFGIIYKH
jgi:hypothetical protein